MVSSGLPPDDYGFVNRHGLSRKVNFRLVKNVRQY